MANSIGLYQFNNYYNRIVKVYGTLTGYYTNSAHSTFVNNVNFNPNDGVSTKLIINFNADWIPDYLTVQDDQENIMSRWFVMEATRTRLGQFEITLRNDLIANHLAEIISAPAFIEKATLKADDPAIFNKEDMGFNQIARKQILLNDRSNGGWIVGYTDRSYSENITATLKSFPASQTVQTEDELPFYRYRQGANVAKFRNYYWWLEIPVDGEAFGTVSQTYTFYLGTNKVPTTGGSSARFSFSASGVDEFNSRISIPKDTIVSNLLSADIYDLSSWRDKIIEVGGVLKQVKVYTIAYTETKTISVGSAPYIAIKNAINAAQGGVWYDDRTDSLTAKIEGYGQQYYLVDYEPGNVTCNIPNTHLHTQDAPYDIFAIPYGNTVIKYGTSAQTVPDPEAAFAIAMEIGNTANVYDVQLLPYCPLQDYIESNGVMNIRGQTTDGIDFTTIVKEGIAVGMILWVPKSQFSFNLTLSEEIEMPDDPVEIKVKSETEMYRLCSPNYSSMYEFDPYKNNGVDRFVVSATYKPGSPYIHIRPDFKYLYGEFENDVRGLICSGDFSISLTQDQWENYTLQNKYFQQIFDRQIENMEFNNKYARMEAGWSAGIGSVQGAVSGAGTGLMASGSPIGAVVGGVVGGGVSAAGGIVDYNILKKQQAETLDFTKDQFGYNLKTVKALPDTLSKVTAFTNQNTIFPTLQVYDSTEIEKEALRRKIKYNGMTVMRIATIGEFLRDDYSYIKGKFIRLEGLSIETHEAIEIAEEFNKGVFIKS